jgi:hypothetical protein
MVTLTQDQHTDAQARVRQLTVPSAARTLSTLSRIDYEDAFRIEGIAGRVRTGEQWARFVVEDAPATVRAKLVCGWSALGLNVRPGVAGRVLGWAIVRASPEYVLLGASSPYGLSGELLFRREPDAMVFATLVMLRHPAARAGWARIEARHQDVVRSLLEHAARRVSLGQSAVNLGDFPPPVGGKSP